MALAFQAGLTGSRGNQASRVEQLLKYSLNLFDPGTCDGPSLTLLAILDHTLCFRVAELAPTELADENRSKHWMPKFCSWCCSQGTSGARRLSDLSSAGRKRCHAQETKNSAKSVEQVERAEACRQWARNHRTSRQKNSQSRRWATESQFLGGGGGVTNLHPCDLVDTPTLASDRNICIHEFKQTGLDFPWGKSETTVWRCNKIFGLAPKRRQISRSSRG